MEDYFCHNTECSNHILCNSNMEVLDVTVNSQDFKKEILLTPIKSLKEIENFKHRLIKRHEIRNALGEFIGYFCDDCVKRIK